MKPSPKTGTLLRVIFCLLGAPLPALPPVEVLPLPTVVAQSNAWGRESEAQAVAFAGDTGSMRPYLHGWETLCMERRTWRTPVAVGDLVVFVIENGEKRVHRITALRGGYFEAKGLNNPGSDGWRPLGRIRYVVRRVLRVSSLSGNPAGI